MDDFLSSFTHLFSTCIFRSAFFNPILGFKQGHAFRSRLPNFGGFSRNSTAFHEIKKTKIPVFFFSGSRFRESDCYDVTKISRNCFGISEFLVLPELSKRTRNFEKNRKFRGRENPVFEFWPSCFNKINKEVVI